MDYERNEAQLKYICRLCSCADNGCWHKMEHELLFSILFFVAIWSIFHIRKKQKQKQKKKKKRQKKQKKKKKRKHKKKRVNATSNTDILFYKYITFQYSQTALSLKEIMSSLCLTLYRNKNCISMNAIKPILFLLFQCDGADNEIKLK